MDICVSLSSAINNTLIKLYRLHRYLHVNGFSGIQDMIWVKTIVQRVDTSRTLEIENFFVHTHVPKPDQDLCRPYSFRVLLCAPTHTMGSRYLSESVYKIE